MEFYKLHKNIFESQEYSIYQKIIITILQSYQADGKYWFETKEAIAKYIGISLSQLKVELKGLKDKKRIFYIFKSEVDKKRQYKNRKAIVLVDKNNPLPEEELKLAPQPIVEQPIAERKPEPKIEESGVAPQPVSATSKYPDVMGCIEEYAKTYNGAPGVKYFIQDIYKAGIVRTTEEAIELFKDQTKYENAIKKLYQNRANH